MRRCVVEGFLYRENTWKKLTIPRMFSGPLWKPDIRHHSYSQTSIKQKISSMMEQTDVILYWSICFMWRGKKLTAAGMGLLRWKTPQWHSTCCLVPHGEVPLPHRRSGSWMSWKQRNGIKQREGWGIAQKMFCPQLVLQGLHLHGIGNKKNRHMTWYRGNYSEDNTGGAGERKPRGRKQGTG